MKRDRSNSSRPAPLTAQIPTITIGQNVPGLPAPLPNVTIPVQGSSLGDTVYYLVHSLFDPRILMNNGDGPTFTNRYMVAEPGFQYIELAHDYLYRIIFDVFKYRNEPSPGVIRDILDNIVDIGRMLGIYLTALSLKQSRDPEMYRRARVLGLHDSLAEMSASLQMLPCPANVAALNVKYIGLGDISGSPALYQNIGFLVNGNYNAFNALYANVRSRTLALNFMRRMYPELGVIGDPGPRNHADMLEAFTNAHLTLGDGTFSPYVKAAGSTMEVQQLAASGILHTVEENSTTYYTMTGWAIPGTGYNVGSERVPVPSLCVWNDIQEVDAAITRANASAYSVTGTDHTFAAVANSTLAANIGHEYNMNSTNQNPAFNTGSFDQSGGVRVLERNFTLEDTRYRVSAGFQLESLSYRLDGNLMSGLYAMLS